MPDGKPHPAIARPKPNKYAVQLPNSSPATRAETTGGPQKGGWSLGSMNPFS
jgi:hypothetical protein